MALDPKTSRRALFAVALSLLVAAAALMFWGNAGSRSLAMLAVLASLGVGRRARAAGALLPGAVAVGGSPPKPVRWWLGALLFGLVGAAYSLLNYAEHHEWTNLFPVYLFAATLVAAFWWLSGLLTRWV